MSLRRRGIGKRSDAPPRRHKDTFNGEGGSSKPTRTCHDRSRWRVICRSSTVLSAVAKSRWRPIRAPSAAIRLDRGAGSSVGPKCYACAVLATTRCQNCGALSCAVHLKPIYVPHGEGGANELRCASCYSSVQARNPYSWVVGVAVTVLVALATYALIVFQMKC